MATNKYAKLIMVTADNNNKYYEMIWEGGTNFTVKYGRVELTETTLSYPISQWDTKYREKVKKGYKDVTDMVAVQVDEKDTKDGMMVGVIADRKVEQFMKKMKAYTDNLVSTTYSVKADKVSQKQVDQAQKILDSLNQTAKKYLLKPVGAIKARLDGDVNEGLIDLYTIIPRKMSNVKNYLLPQVKLENILRQEQDNLDAMTAQVSMITPKKKIKTDKTQSILDVLGITMKETKPTKEIQYLVDQCGRGVGAKIETIFEVNNPKEDKVFNGWMGKQKNKQTRILIHGTKNTSVIPILEIGLKIRPVGNFQFSGKAYGDGNYYSETVQKSLGYTGWEEDKVLFVYEVHTGKPFVYNGWYTGNSFTLNYKNLQAKGYDSTFVSAGNGLLNSEIIAYNEQQNRIKYIIWLK